MPDFSSEDTRNESLHHSKKRNVGIPDPWMRSCLLHGEHIFPTAAIWIHVVNNPSSGSVWADPQQCIEHSARFGVSNPAYAPILYHKIVLDSLQYHSGKQVLTPRGVSPRRGGLGSDPDFTTALNLMTALNSVLSGRPAFYLVPPRRPKPHVLCPFVRKLKALNCVPRYFHFVLF